MSLSSSLQDFFGIILKGESKTYNDHNWYAGGSLKGYIQGGYGNPYSLLKKPLSEYTIGEVKKFQARGRDSIGQLWATGRYQIIPTSLIGAQKSAGLPDSALYNKENQDKLGLTFLKGRKNLWNYIKGSVPDNQDNLNKAIVDVAMTWSSVGVPYKMNGRYGMIQKDQSYYSGGGDKASVKSETVGEALRKLRAGYTGVQEVGQFVKKNKSFFIVLAILLASSAGWIIYRTIKNKPIIPKLK